MDRPGRVRDRRQPGHRQGVRGAARRAGFDVAVLARTVVEGEAREHSSTVAHSDTTPLPGSLTTTADLIRAEGRDALLLAGDLLDRASLGAAATTVLERWGRVDVLVNNARYIGPGHMDRLLDTPLELLDRHLDANVMAPLVLSRLLLPQMIERGTGLIANITSGVAWMDPKAPAGAGGWGLGYAISKGALHRVAGVLNAELEGTGVVCVNVDPGYVGTERIAQDMARFGYRRERRRTARRRRHGGRVARDREPGGRVGQPHVRRPGGLRRAGPAPRLHAGREPGVTTPPACDVTKPRRSSRTSAFTDPVRRRLRSEHPLDGTT